jgi:choline-glycine betaine transporter
MVVAYSVVPTVVGLLSALVAIRFAEASLLQSVAIYAGSGLSTIALLVVCSLCCAMRRDARGHRRKKQISGTDTPGRRSPQPLMQRKIANSFS